jgi:hypothetical protein
VNQMPGDRPAHRAEARNSDPKLRRCLVHVVNP